MENEEEMNRAERPQKKKHRGWIIWLVVLVLIAGGVGGYMYLQQPKAAPTPKVTETAKQNDSLVTLIGVHVAADGTVSQQVVVGKYNEVSSKITSWLSQQTVQKNEYKGTVLVDGDITKDQTAPIVVGYVLNSSYETVTAKVFTDGDVANLQSQANLWAAGQLSSNSEAFVGGNVTLNPPGQ
ncbi:MAG: hypothetical protein LBI43_05100 [Streptococcaceae bacterium]|jgi:flagellar basal body-associated protein FliL|nr:hypothetical protein [Streptococcaceae bacterium]